MVGQEIAESQRRPMAPSYNTLATIGMIHSIQLDFNKREADRSRKFGISE